MLTRKDETQLRSGPGQDQNEIDPGLSTLAPHPFSSPGTKTPRQSTDPRKRGDERATLFLHLPSTGKAGIRPVRLSRRQGENCESSVTSEETPELIPGRASRSQRMRRNRTRPHLEATRPARVWKMATEISPPTSPLSGTNVNSNFQSPLLIGGGQPLVRPLSREGRDSGRPPFYPHSDPTRRPLYSFPPIG